jgi:hypothetical protein
VWITAKPLLTKFPGPGVADPGLLHIRRMRGYASVALCACLGLGELAPHHGYLDLLGYFRPRRVDVLAPLLGVMREDLVIADALASAQIYGAGRLADPRRRRLRHRARLQAANETHRFRHGQVPA